MLSPSVSFREDAFEGCPGLPLIGSRGFGPNGIEEGAGLPLGVTKSACLDRGEQVDDLRLKAIQPIAGFGPFQTRLRRLKGPFGGSARPVSRPIAQEEGHANGDKCESNPAIPPVLTRDSGPAARR